MAEKKSESMRGRAVKAALKLAADKPWAEVTLRDIAMAAGIGLADLQAEIDGKPDILAAYGRMIDRKVLSQADGADESVSPRDRLFELLMERFDVLNDDRAGVLSVIRSLKCDPAQAIITLPHLGQSMGWILEAAGIAVHGWQGAVKILGLTAVYLETLRHWAEDETEDMSVTMAALDKSLERAEKWAGRLE